MNLNPALKNKAVKIQKLISKGGKPRWFFAATLLALFLALGGRSEAQIIADWSFNGNLTDSINGYDGTFFGGTPTYTTITTGDTTGEALVLNGSSNYMTVAVPSASLLNLNATSFTTSAWLYINTESVAEREAIIVGRYPPSNLKNIAITADYSSQVGGGTGPIIYGYTGNVNGISGGHAPYGTYENITLTYDQSASTLTLYINGIEKSQSTSATGPTAEPNDTDSYYFGYGPQSPAYLAGDLDEVQIYGNSMTQAQVTALYNDGNGPLPVVPEPSSGAMLLSAAGIALLFWRLRRCVGCRV